MFEVKDFIATAEGLLFAVVAQGLEKGKVRCFLRYAMQNGTWYKCTTQQANDLLQQYYPQYLFDSKQLAASLHGVEVNAITQHYIPKQVLQTLLQVKINDSVIKDMQQLIHFLTEQGINSEFLGITGSILINKQTINSDIDIVCYDLMFFKQCRMAIAYLISAGQLYPLSDKDWQESYSRRDCDLSFMEYVWHEQRKLNKALINGRKFDLSCLTSANDLNVQYQKCGFISLQTKIIDDSLGFAYPAEWLIEHETIKSVVSFSATYNGQVFTGELVEIAGLLELVDNGDYRIVIGSNREARGEYIKCLFE